MEYSTFGLWAATLLLIEGGSLLELEEAARAAVDRPTGPFDPVSEVLGPLPGAFRKQSTDERREPEGCRWLTAD